MYHQYTPCNAMGFLPLASRPLEMAHHMHACKLRQYWKEGEMELPMALSAPLNPRAYLQIASIKLKVRELLRRLHGGIDELWLNLV